MHTISIYLIIAHFLKTYILKYILPINFPPSCLHLFLVFMGAILCESPRIIELLIYGHFIGTYWYLDNFILIWILYYIWGDNTAPTENVRSYIFANIIINASCIIKPCTWIRVRLPYIWTIDIKYFLPQ